MSVQGRFFVLYVRILLEGPINLGRLFPQTSQATINIDGNVPALRDKYRKISISLSKNNKNAKALVSQYLKKK